MPLLMSSKKRKLTDVSHTKFSFLRREKPVVSLRTTYACDSDGWRFDGRYMAIRRLKELVSYISYSFRDTNTERISTVNPLHMN